MLRLITVHPASHLGVDLIKQLFVGCAEADAQAQFVQQLRRCQSRSGIRLRHYLRNCRHCRWTEYPASCDKLAKQMQYGKPCDLRRIAADCPTQMNPRPRVKEERFPAEQRVGELLVALQTVFGQ